MSETTWWDDRLNDKKTFDFFVENLGGPDMPSRVAVRKWAHQHDVVTVLDAGCGPALDRWEGTGVSWRGIDNSKLLVEHVGSPLVHHGSVEQLPFRNGDFEMVYSRHVWEHLPDFKTALKEACRVASHYVAVVFFIPPASAHKTHKMDGAYYNKYSMLTISDAFMDQWPHCRIDTLTLPAQKYLPDGEFIMFVSKDGAK